MKMRVLVLLIVMSSVVNAGTKVIYGDDNRVDVNESNNAMFRELARSTAGMISPSKIDIDGDEATISGSTLQQRGMCSSERFANQITAARCSGFLVGDDLLVTAGHCVRSMSDCRNYKWVFDYNYDESKANFTVPASSVYGCSEIIEQKLSGSGSDADDYALVRLDRKVADRTALEFRTSGKPSLNDPLVVIGHPTGLPTKIADGANIMSLKNKFFNANLDTYGGNSGSAVFNSETGVVEGILVRGARDYVRRGSCQVSNRIGNRSGSGEAVTYITNIEALK